MPERVEVVQLTLTPEEAVWLYVVANTGHLLAIAYGAVMSGADGDAASFRMLAGRQFNEVFVYGEILEQPQDVLDRLQKLIENVTRAVIFKDVK